MEKLYLKVFYDSDQQRKHHSEEMPATLGGYLEDHCISLLELHPILKGRARCFTCFHEMRKRATTQNQRARFSLGRRNASLRHPTLSSLRGTVMHLSKIPRKLYWRARVLQGIKASGRQAVPGADRGEGKGKPLSHSCRGLRASPCTGGGLSPNPASSIPGVTASPRCTRWTWMPRGWSRARNPLSSSSGPH